MQFAFERSDKKAGVESAETTIEDRRVVVGRDFAYDALRVVSLFFVVLVHYSEWLFFFDARCPEPHRCPVEAPTLDYSVTAQWLSWIGITMPLVFFVGGASNALSFTSTQTWGGYILRRIRRMYRPLLWFFPLMLVLGFVYTRFYPLGVGRVLTPAGLDSLTVPVEKLGLISMGPTGLALLWYLALYPFYLACVPLFARIRTVRGVAALVGACLVLIGISDYFRINNILGMHDALSPYLLVTVMVWAIPFSLGTAYRRGLIPDRAGIWIAAGALLGCAALYSSGCYASGMHPMLNTHGRLSNDPATLFFAVYCILWSGFAIAIANQVRKIGSNDGARKFVQVMNRGAVTFYLGHWAALYAFNTFMLVFGLYPTRTSPPSFWSDRGPGLLLFPALVCVVFLVFRKFETRSVPWWDKPVRVDGWRSPVVGVLLLCAAFSMYAAMLALWKGPLLLVPLLGFLLAARIVAGLGGGRSADSQLPSEMESPSREASYVA